MADFIHYGQLIEEVFKLADHNGKYDFYALMDNCQTEFERQRVYRLYYKHNHDLIMENLKKNKWFNCYGIDFTKYFTPIEYNAWCVIKCRPMIFYPQYPVLNYILDFANPLLKVGIELDGKEFHNHEKDLAKDKILSKEGWIIYRITGSEAVRPVIEFRRDHYDELEYYLNNTIEGIIEALYVIHFCKGHNIPEDYEYIQMCHRALKNHNNIKI